MLVGLAQVRWSTGGRSAIYPVLLWLVPLLTSFMFFMFLRDVYQHSNADAGRLTNSRVFFTDYFTRWAVFVYGQDYAHSASPVSRRCRITGWGGCTSC